MHGTSETTITLQRCQPDHKFGMNAYLMEASKQQAYGSVLMTDETTTTGEPYLELQRMEEEDTWTNES